MASDGDRRAPFWLLLGGTVLVDRVTKIWAVNALTGHEGIEVVGDLVRLDLIYNRGAAFGLGNQYGHIARWVFLAVALIAVPVLHRLWREAPLADRVRQYALGFIAGGALGNGIDRILSDRGVVDFLDFGIGASRFPTFNVADIAVSCGAVVLAVTFWHEDRHQQTDAAPAPPPP